MSLKNNQTQPGGGVGSQECLWPSRLCTCLSPHHPFMHPEAESGLPGRRGKDRRERGRNVPTVARLARVWSGHVRRDSQHPSGALRPSWPPDPLLCWLLLWTGLCLRLCPAGGCWEVGRNPGSVRLAVGGGGGTCAPRPGPRAVLARQLVRLWYVQQDHTEDKDSGFHRQPQPLPLLPVSCPVQTALPALVLRWEGGKKGERRPFAGQRPRQILCLSTSAHRTRCPLPGGRSSCYSFWLPSPLLLVLAAQPLFPLLAARKDGVQGKVFL